MTDNPLDEMLREVTQGECPQCSKEFTKNRSDQKFCSDRCRNLFHTFRRRVQQRGPLVDAEGNLTWSGTEWAYQTLRDTRARIYKLIEDTLGIDPARIRSIEQRMLSEEKGRLPTAGRRSK